MDPSRALAEAVETLLTPTGYPVYLGEVTAADADLEFPYLVVWMPPVARSATGLDAVSTQHDVTFQVSVAGRDEDETLAAADRAAAALVDQIPTVAGRLFNQIEQLLINQPPRPDPGGRAPATQRPVFMVPLMFATWSVPA